MKKARFLILVLACVGAIHGSAHAQVTAAYFNCVVTCGSPLESYSGAATMAIVAGYDLPGDGGGGVYVAGTACPDGTATGKFTAGQVAVSVYNPGASVFVVGSVLSGSGFIPPGTEIASVNGPTMTMTEPATQSEPTGTSFSVLGNNGGTLIRDLAPTCFYKTDYRGDPHEWAAVGDGNANDTQPLQYWLGAYGMVSNPASTTPPSNFGPWIATIPANYSVSQPLVCPPYAVLQGFANISGGIPNNGGGAANPTVIITAAAPSMGIPSLTNSLGLPALMTASQYCRISGIALDVNGNDAFAINGAVGSTNGTTTVSFMNPLATWVVPGVPINDSNAGNCIPPGAVVMSVGGGRTTVTISDPQSAPIGTCATDAITITGFYNVDVIGTHVAIDGHTRISGGYHGVHCADYQVDGLEIRDSTVFKAYDNGVHLTGHCDDVRVVGDTIDRSGQDTLGAGLYFSGSDLSLESGVVEESAGPNILISGARLVTVNGMVVDGSGLNGTGMGIQFGSGIVVDTSTHVSICGNRFERSGVDLSSSSHVLFSGVSDNITLCGNTYNVGSFGSDANVYPSYDFDVLSTPSTPTLTNLHIYDTAEQPAVSVFNPALALALLQPLQIPQFTNNQLSGLTLSNSGTQAINIAPGEATDSTNSTVISLPTGCSVNLASVTNGAKALDTGSIASNTTYYIYIIAAPAASGGGSIATPSCMASTSLVPSFFASSFASSGYLVTATGGTVSASNTVYNANPLAGVSVGNAIESHDTALPSLTTITGFSANFVPSSQPMGSWASGSTTITIPSGITNLQPGMSVVGGCLPGYAYVSSYSGTNLVISSNTAGCAGSGVQLSISGARQLVLNNNASITEAVSNNLSIGIGYYRMIGAIYTTSAMTPTIVPFVQDNDTFYLATPVTDINAAAVSSTASSFALSVPHGIQVQAMGRCTGATGHILLFTQGTTPATPGPFPTAPGYSVRNSAASDAAFPFNLYTAAGTATIEAVSDVNSTLDCVTDGWVWHRAQ